MKIELKPIGIWREERLDDIGDWKLSAHTKDRVVWKPKKIRRRDERLWAGGHDVVMSKKSLMPASVPMVMHHPWKVELPKPTFPGAGNTFEKRKNALRYAIDWMKENKNYEKLREKRIEYKKNRGW